MQSMSDRYRIIPLDLKRDDFGVYAKQRTGIFGTPLIFRGTMVECREFVREGCPHGKQTEGV